MESISHFFLALVDKLGYPGLFLVMTLGNTGVPVATELVMIAAGALSATGHLSSVWLAGFVATLGEVVGNAVLYSVGFFGGRPFVLRYGKYVKLSEARLDTFHRFSEKHGSGIVFVCRFIPGVRGLVALPAGVSRMPKRWFFAYTAAGSAVFCFGLAYLGSLFGTHFNDIQPQIHKASVLIVLVVILAAIAAAVYAVSRGRTRL